VEEKHLNNLIRHLKQNGAIVRKPVSGMPRTAQIYSNVNAVGEVVDDWRKSLDPHKGHHFKHFL